jgi:beta-lactamase superfamily II metal-dependent hydrolase
MIHLTFKNVGQGDSIILEWNDKDIAKICIIDCKLYHDKNPVLDYLIEKKYKTIDYLILSHPHLDHFSGFLQIIEYCNSNSIKILYFLHTCIQVPTFLKTASKSAEAERELQKLFLSLHKNNQNHSFKVATIQGDAPNSSIPITKEISLKILSPTLHEFDLYTENAHYPFNEEESLDNPKANWLSTIIKIESANWYILLTSDADKASLIRIDKHETNELDKMLVLGQIPHHGSISNHNNTFWKIRKRLDKTAMVVSSGQNSYNHPSTPVLDFFKKNNFIIYSTSEDSIISNKLIKEIRETLDIYSYAEPKENSSLNGDQKFQFHVSEIGYKYLPNKDIV